MTVQNYKLIIQYDGRPFCGWQRQSNGPTIQAEIESVLWRIWPEKPALHGSGRTDAGVHARGQVANFLATPKLAPSELLSALNGELPKEIRIKSVSVVNEDFHSQYSAVDKTYRYLLLSSRARSPFLPFYCSWTSFSLDRDRIFSGASKFVGTHDFISMMGRGSSIRSTVRTITSFKVVENNGLFSFTVTASGFLKNMVRNMVGTLVEIGRGRMTPESVKDILSSMDRKNAGPTAPAEGLTLIKVRYK